MRGRVGENERDVILMSKFDISIMCHGKISFGMPNLGQKLEGSIDDFKKEDEIEEEK
jgi:hypothetical protein